MAKFLVTYKIETVSFETKEVEEEDVMLALDNARRRAKSLTEGHPINNISDADKKIWSLVSINQIDGE